MPIRTPVVRSLLAAALVGGLAACATAPHGNGVRSSGKAQGRLITSDHIAASGAQTAWEVLRRAGVLSMQESPRGEPRAMRMRGRSSVFLDDTPIVVLDGVRMSDIGILREIRANTIATIEIMSGVEGTGRHGTGAGGGAIVIRTLLTPQN
jgi:outer membrane cobalamin receptor